MNKKPVYPENTPANAVPYRTIDQPFRFRTAVPGKGIRMSVDANGVLFIETEGGESLSDLEAGDNIEITRREDGKIVISAGGQVGSAIVDPQNGESVIYIVNPPVDEHYKGIFETTQALIASVRNPRHGDYGMVKNLVFTDGGSNTWNGQYKYCFYIDGTWQVVDQMLTFTDDEGLVKQFYSVGGSSPVIYLSKVAASGNFDDLKNIPIVSTPIVTVEGNIVSATCATEGAELWYTTDGSMPHVNGTKYTGPITVSGATTFRFVGIKNGMINSEEATVGADFSLESPIIDYDYHTAKVTLSNPNVDGSDNPVGAIYYTIDGSEPTSASTLYNGPINVQTSGYTTSRSVRAVVYDSGNDRYSEIASAVYQKSKTNGSQSYNAETGRVSQFWIYPEGPTSVAPAADGEIYYTLDGSTPDSDSTPLTETLYFSRYGGPVTLKVIGYRPGWLPTNIRTVSVNYDKPTAPVIFGSENNTVTIGTAGNVSASPSIPLKTTSDNPNLGCRIYYTLDGSTPTEQSTLYTGPFQIGGNVTVKAVLVAYGQYYSDVVSETIAMMEAPVISLDPETGLISIDNPNNTGIIYYTDVADGTPDKVYTEPFFGKPSSATNVKAYVKADTDSPLAKATYLPIPASTFGGYQYDYTNGVCRVNPPSAPSFGYVRYSTDGIPGPDAPLVPAKLSTPLFDSGNPVRFWCKICADGYVPTTVISEYMGYVQPTAPEITVDDQSGMCTIALAGNTVRIPLQTNNNVPSMGARIYYTLDGSTPTAQTGTLYQNEAVSVPEGTSVIKAVTVCYGEFESDVATEHIAPEPSVDYMYFEAVEANSTVSMMSMLETAPDLEYSTDGETWQEWQHTTADGTHTFDTLTLGRIGDHVYLRGNNPDGFLDIENDTFSLFGMTGKIAAGGNAQTLVDGDAPTLVAKTMPLFSDSSLTEQPSAVLIAAPALPATTLADSCYYGMFSGCAGLTAAPALPATTLAEGCYAFMFTGSTGLTAAPALPATTLAEGCYSYMFAGCTGLTAAPALPATTLAEGCYFFMFVGCTFNMSDDGTTFNFDCSATLPQTVGEDTFGTPYDLAVWMGNTNGFN